jgi:hypothetical protein
VFNDDALVTYSSTSYRLLISAPSDVPDGDLTIVSEAVNRWNALYGPQFGAVVVPIHWKLHSAAEHGGRPQASLNEQLVKDADIAIAIFWHRLGSPTGEEESGTVEEIETAHRNGAYVAILRREHDFPQDVDLDQIERLRAFCQDSEARSLMLGYADEANLARHVDAILNRAVTRNTTRAEAAAQAQSGGADVWPRVESSEQLKTDSKGRAKTERRWQLVLSNTGSEAAENVEYRLEPENDGDELPIELDERRHLEVLAPNGEAAYILVMHGGVASQARCIVSWQDSTGAHENRATLRFF